MIRLERFGLTPGRVGMALSLLIIVYVLIISIARTMMPAQLSVFEGKILCQAFEFSQGTEIYRDPSLYHPADIYTPLYQMLISVFFKCAAPTFVWGRLVSLIASIAVCVLFCAWFWKLERGGRLVGIIVAAMFAGTAWQTEWFFSTAKSDAVCHLLWVAALAVLLFEKKWLVLLSGALIATAFFFKQTGIFAAPGIVLFLLLERKRDAFLFVLAAVTTWLCLYASLNAVAGSWMPFYIFGRMQIAASHGARVPVILERAFSLAGSPLLIIAAMSAIAMAGVYWQNRAYRLTLLTMPFLVAGSLFTAASCDGSQNSMMPAFYSFVFLGGFGVAGFLGRSEGQPANAWLICLLLIFQFDPAMPYNVSKALGRFDTDFIETVECLKKHGGQMYAPSNNVLTLLAGHPEFDDLVLAKYIEPKKPESVRRIKEKINSLRYERLIFSKYEQDALLMTEATRNAYDVELDVGDWLTFRKR